MRTLAAPVHRGITCLICGDRLPQEVNAGTAHRTECPVSPPSADKETHT